jgi:hypothetical protein
MGRHRRVCPVMSCVAALLRSVVLPGRAQVVDLTLPLPTRPSSHPAADDATTMHQKKGGIDERKQQ